MRRRVRPPEGIPARLAVFRPEEWSKWPDEPSSTTYRRWSAALEAWARAHPEAAETVDAVRSAVVVPDQPWNPYAPGAL